MRVRVHGLKTYFEPKTGKVYSYHRKTGTRIHAAPGSPEFFAEIAVAEARIAPKTDPKPGTLGMIIKEYRASHNFLTLKPRTQRDYMKVLDYLKSMDGVAIASLGSAQIVKIRDRTYELKNRSFANYVLAVLSILFSFALERGVIRVNLVREVKKIRKRDGQGRPNRPWTRTEWETVIGRAPSHLALPLSIGRWTGLREGDVLRLPRSAYDGEHIRLKTSKRGVLVSIPVAQPLKQLLDSNVGGIAAITLCTNSRRQPWTESGFRASLFKFLRGLRRAELISAGLTFHGLRHTVATELRQLGFDTRTIADMLGQKSEAMAVHYSREADLSEKMQKAIDAMERANTR